MRWKRLKNNQSKNRTAIIKTGSVLSWLTYAVLTELSMPGFDQPNFTAMLVGLLVAAGVGFLVGFEREWVHAEEERRQTFAGARTFTMKSAWENTSAAEDATFAPALE